MESVHEKTQAVSDSFTSLGEDLQDIRDIFVETRDTIGGIFGFMGKETALLLLFTFLFLFVAIGSVDVATFPLLVLQVEEQPSAHGNEGYKGAHDDKYSVVCHN